MPKPNQTKRKENKIKSLRRELLIISSFIIRVLGCVRAHCAVYLFVAWFPLESARMASVQAVIHFKELVKTLKNTPTNQPTKKT